MIEFMKLNIKCWQNIGVTVKLRLGRVQHLSAQIYLPKGRTGNGSPTQASLYPLYFVTIFTRQPVIGPLFRTLQISWD